ncbi:hypothetical protein HO173_003497 [Letharia columbiana]|uniref:Uncharacterized protein n=1 Tax=Letharia columbiana TaxID=112416 RepID=A0A8H6G178_9LECA|nr:uncharacterized protein HO173_003497 [Letharia columbiana]KAF6238528.1 hypothetical protein HO173_003497 [Letharia columbiana]
MSIGDQLRIASWLSRLPNTSPPCPSSAPPSPQSPTLPAAGKLQSVKRKALQDPSSPVSHKKPRLTQRLTRQALRSITANMSKSKQKVAELRSSTPVKSMPPPSTPYKPQSPLRPPSPILTSRARRPRSSNYSHLSQHNRLHRIPETDQECSLDPNISRSKWHVVQYNRAARELPGF